MRLFHFRQEFNNFWRCCDMITETATSGASMIQTMPEGHRNLVHGDFEILVAEEGGYISQYTRVNSVQLPTPFLNGDGPPLVNSNIPATIEYHWSWQRTSRITARDQYGKPLAIIGAAPLVQSLIPMSGNAGGATLETLIWDAEGKIIHYRCPQALDGRYKWHRGAVVVNATGVAYLYHQTLSDTLIAIIPTIDGIREYRFRSGIWQFITVVTRDATAVGGIYTKPAVGLATLYILVYGKQGEAPVELERDGGLWSPTAGMWPDFLQYPFTVWSNPTFTLSPDIQLLACNDCTIQHWTLTFSIDRQPIGWIISAVVARLIEGMGLPA
ncbi:hypothetical protein GGR51DRAFT_515006 [Nemania sp. FL0031]|nr:hypothetical protein GGR51DRAFT_515006 [Nemania sp. FL0031]